MVDFKEAYKMSDNCFKQNDLNGIGEILEGNDFWLFRPKLDKMSFGTFSVIVYMDDINRAQLLWVPDEINIREKINGAKIIYSA